MRWYGKLLGFIAGALLFRPNPLFGAVVGLLIGHAFDSDWFRLNKENPYRELGLTSEATDAEVERAYRKLISQYHPDKLGGAAPSCSSRPSRSRGASTPPTTASRPCASADPFPLVARPGHVPLPHRPLHPVRRFRPPRRGSRQRPGRRCGLGPLRRDGQPLRTQPDHRPDGLPGTAQARRDRADRRAPDGRAGGPHHPGLRRSRCHLHQLPSGGQPPRAPHDPADPFAGLQAGHRAEPGHPCGHPRLGAG